MKKVTNKIKKFIIDSLDSSNKNGVVIGLSGGIDSAVVAKLCIDTLGSKNVLCIFMPTKSTPIEDFRDIKLLEKYLKIKIKIVYIDNIVKELILEKLDKKSLGNIYPRVRMIVLYEYANLMNRLVCGTGNKTELSIGYFTKYGDGGVDINPIAHLYKTDIWELADFLKIPKSIIEKKPTAGLWEGQTDESEIGISYKELDRILKLIENSNHKRFPPNKIED